MIICPNCNHQNPEGSVQCESCYTPLAATAPCPNCGARVQTDATFCGQCGYNLQGNEIKMSSKTNEPFEEDPFGENSHNDVWQEELATTTRSTESFQSPWDVEEEDDDYSELDEDESPLFFEDTEITKPATSPFGVTNEENQELEELSDDETEDIESWLSSMTEESSQGNEEDLGLAMPMAESEELVTPVAEAHIIEYSESEELVTPVAEANILDYSESEELVTPVAEANILDYSESEELVTPVAEANILDYSESEELVTPVAEANILDYSESLNQEPEVATPTQAAFLESKSLETPTITNDFSTQSSSMNIDTSTRLQLQRAILFHLQTGSNLEIPINLSIVHIGKPNNQVPPDIDVSGFPNSEIVSRIHADIRVEGDTYFIEDRGSANGTYVNHSPLLTGNRHRLRAGDRISLGKGDLMTFIFQLD
jgi:ribosomal protein L40E/preprotein translocase subunit Sec61beta